MILFASYHTLMQNYVYSVCASYVLDDRVNRRRNVVTNVSIAFDLQQDKIKCMRGAEHGTDFGATWTTITVRILKLKNICRVHDNLWPMSSKLFMTSWHITSNLKSGCGVRYIWVQRYRKFLSSNSLSSPDNPDAVCSFYCVENFLMFQNFLQ